MRSQPNKYKVILIVGQSTRLHTWGLARSPAELQGGQGQGHHHHHHLVAQLGSELDPKCDT